MTKIVVAVVVISAAFIIQGCVIMINSDNNKVQHNPNNDMDLKADVNKTQ